MLTRSCRALSPAAILLALGAPALAQIAPAIQPARPATPPAQQPQPAPAPAARPAAAPQPAGPDRPALGAEAPSLKNILRLTSPDKFLKAGEAYFDPYTRWIIFQAVPKPQGSETPDEHYSMYVACLTRDAAGHITGMNAPIRISAERSANTCGFFNPLSPYKVIFGSTLVAPVPEPDAQGGGFHRENGKYTWEFPVEMEVSSRTVNQIFDDILPVKRDPSDAAADAAKAIALFSRPGYDAECAFSPDARFICYTHVEPGSKNPDIYIYDIANNRHVPIVTQPGYDGGPFFSPDGKHLCYRSDRNSDSLLQLMVADLDFDTPPIDPVAAKAEDYTPPPSILKGLKREHAVTANKFVNWAPFWSPDGSFLIYATSEASPEKHDNYELYTVEAPVGANAEKTAADLRHRRITTSVGFDGLPAFNRDARFLMWTSQRPGDAKGLPLPASDPKSAEKSSSQIWVAEALDIKP